MRRMPVQITFAFSRLCLQLSMFPAECGRCAHKPFVIPIVVIEIRVVVAEQPVSSWIGMPRGARTSMHRIFSHWFVRIHANGTFTLFYYTRMSSVHKINYSEYHIYATDSLVDFEQVTKRPNKLVMSLKSVRMCGKREGCVQSYIP